MSRDDQRSVHHVGDVGQCQHHAYHVIGQSVARGAQRNRAMMDIIRTARIVCGTGYM